MPHLSSLIVFSSWRSCCSHFFGTLYIVYITTLSYICGGNYVADNYHFNAFLSYKVIKLVLFTTYISKIKQKRLQANGYNPYKSMPISILFYNYSIFNVAFDFLFEIRSNLKFLLLLEFQVDKFVERIEREYSVVKRIVGQKCISIKNLYDSHES